MIEDKLKERKAFSMTHPIATIRLAHGPAIVCELYPEEAPNTVRSFLYLARLGCFDHHAMERLAPDFVADMSYTAFGRPEARYLIPYETQSAGFPNHLKADVGTIVMGGYENGIAGGEFFFPLKSNPRLDFSYPAFGRIVEGLEEVLRWNALPVVEVPFDLDPSVRITAPASPIVVERVEVETFGETYPEPERLAGAVLPVNWG